VISALIKKVQRSYLKKSVSTFQPGQLKIYLDRIVNSIQYKHKATVFDPCQPASVPTTTSTITMIYSAPAIVTDELAPSK
jgi:hypothetical protein